MLPAGLLQGREEKEGMVRPGCAGYIGHLFRKQVS